MIWRMAQNRTILILLLNALLALAVSQTNVLIASWNLSLLPDALYLLFPAIFLRIRQAVVIAVIVALLVDATRPTPFGFTLFVYLAGIGSMAAVRHRIRRENPTHLRFLAVILTMILFFILSLLHLPQIGESASIPWLRLLGDATVSLLLVLLITPIWIRFQEWILLACGIDLASELQRL